MSFVIAHYRTYDFDIIITYKTIDKTNAGIAQIIVAGILLSYFLTPIVFFEIIFYQIRFLEKRLDAIQCYTSRM